MYAEKYNLPVPRYTSYPTVPFWDNQNFSKEEYGKTLSTAFWSSSKEVSLYIHLPFCESLCTYCACNTRITKNHEVETPYINHVIKEWEMYIEQLPDTPIIREVHLGGGTPTFFTPENLELLLDGILSRAEKSDELQMSFEGHPANTTEEHLRRLCQLGFDRLSLGIQDFDLKVQKLINRRQSLEQVRMIVELARNIGYKSINFDMVYGLPGQTLESLTSTLNHLIELSPDRVAYYGYAHVPALKPAQKAYESFLPSAEEKFEFMKFGQEFLTKEAYEEVGMDHYVKPEDELLIAREEKDLHRNFMGYTPFTSKLLVGLGTSAISDSWTGFAQNSKSVEDYYVKIDAGELPIIRGHLLTKKDLFIRQLILDLMCKFETSWSKEALIDYGLNLNFDLLNTLLDDQMIAFDETGIYVPPAGRKYIRVICSALDLRLNESGRFPNFSRSI